jgi:hypothetical protein
MLSDLNCNRPERHLNTHTRSQTRLQNSTDLDQETSFGAPRTQVTSKLPLQSFKHTDPDFSFTAQRNNNQKK